MVMRVHVVMGGSSESAGIQRAAPIVAAVAVWQPYRGGYRPRTRPSNVVRVMVVMAVIVTAAVKVIRYDVDAATGGC